MARTFLASSSQADRGNLHAYYLPRGLVTLTIKKQTADGLTRYLMETGEVEIAPDPAQLYFFRYEPGWFSHDDVTLEFQENGLLRSVGTVIEDQTGAFLEQAITLGTSLTRVLADPGLPAVGTRSAEGMVETLLFEGKIDPLDPADLAGLQAALQQDQPGLRFEAKALTPAATSSSAAPRESAGIFCRPPAPCELALYLGDVLQGRLILTLPHKEVLHFVEIPQAPWVKTQFTILFGATGYPVKIHLDKPSSALEFIKFPVSLLKAILEIPASLFKFRVDLEGNRQAAAQQLFEVEQRMTKLQDEVAKQRESQLQQAEEMVAARTSVPGSSAVRGPQNTSRPQPQGGGSSQQTPPANMAEFERILLKLQQDVATMRKRMNKEDEAQG